jgi:hypothetical protein
MRELRLAPVPDRLLLEPLTRILSRSEESSRSNQTHATKRLVLFTLQANSGARLSRDPYSVRQPTANRHQVMDSPGLALRPVNDRALRRLRAASKEWPL